jgi:hypothetical protein
MGHNFDEKGKKCYIQKLYLSDMVKSAKLFNTSIRFLHINENIILPEDNVGYRMVLQIIKHDKIYV